MTNQFICKHILLTAPGRNYEIRFDRGVNIVSGTIFTGKSSIAELIDYVCGAKMPLKYPEIKKCSDVLVYFEISEESVTIRRSLANSTAKALVYSGTMDEALNGTASFIEVSWKYEKGKASLSSELLNRLGIGEVDVKQAPTQKASDTTAFSLRDLMPLIYVDQDRLGKKPSFFENEFANFIKWKAGFQILHRLYDAKATNISRLLKIAKDEESELKEELQINQRFLEKSKILEVDELVGKLRHVEKLLEKQKLSTHQQREEEVQALGETSELLSQRSELVKELLSTRAKESELERTLLQLGRLRVQYEREFSQLEFLKESNSIISSVPVSRCPACLQSAVHNLSETSCYICHKQLPKSEDEPRLEGQLRSLSFRIRDLENYSKQLTEDQKSTRSNRSHLSLRLADLDKELDAINTRVVFPRDRRLLEVASKLAKLEKEKADYETQLDLRYRARGDYSNMLTIQQKINTLQSQLSTQLSKTPKADQVIADLSQLFSKVLQTFRFPWNVENARLSVDDFLPIVREQDYKEIRSNGAIALIQCAFQFALLEYALEGKSIVPCFLILDSPLNHVGKASDDPAFRDQKIVDAFYSYLHALNAKHKHLMQVIIFDNGPPLGVAGLPRIHFSGEKDNGRCGLIDDEYPTEELKQSRLERLR